MNGKRSTVSSLQGVVAAAHPLAASAGVRILGDGGNAFDAAAATGAALNVVEPYSSGLAGCGIAICYVAAEDRIRVLNFVPSFPRAFDFASIDDRFSIRRGGYGTGLPACLAGWAELVRKYGKLPFSDTLSPAIRLAREGFPQIELNVEALRASRQQLMALPRLFADWAAIYGDTDLANQFGSVLQQPKLAETYEAIAKLGADYLYDGPLGNEIVGSVRAHGGCITREDIASVKPIWQDGICVRYRGNEIYAPPPPSHAFQYLLTMALLEKSNAADLRDREGDRLNLLFRLIRLSARARIEGQIDSAEAFYRLIDEESLRHLASKIETEEAVDGPTEYPKAGSLLDEENLRQLGSKIKTKQTVDGSTENTTSFSIADREGNLVAVTQSLGLYFGSGIVTPHHGVALNNLLHYGDLSGTGEGMPPKPFEHPMSPSIVIRQSGERLAFGTPGSFGILQTQAQVLTNYLDLGMSLQEAFDAPRARLWPGRQVAIEGRAGETTLNSLSTHGHDVVVAKDWTILVGAMNGVVRHSSSGAISGASDLRRDGHAVAV
ncbi:gamma-glutamyltransferase [Bradyrhizobium erythrophlei]|uniref:gamma-glutamyltransferase n=1 Tax=Bradyrhizobium erythrophlei TaxID=1437360 RepID=UPI0035E6F4A5